MTVPVILYGAIVGIYILQRRVTSKELICCLAPRPHSSNIAVTMDMVPQIGYLTFDSCKLFYDRLQIIADNLYE